jgi:hypothetical protein
MTVIMFSTNTLSWANWPMTAASPMATTIDASAIASGMTAATHAPNTSTSTTSAAGNPTPSSPCFKSRRETAMKSRSAE